MLPLNPRDLFLLLETMVKVHVSALTAAQTGLRKKPGGRQPKVGNGHHSINDPDNSKIAGRRPRPKLVDENSTPPAEWEQAQADLLGGITDKNAIAYSRKILRALEPHISRAWAGSHFSQELTGDLSEFKDILDTLDMGVIVVGSAGAIRYINKPARQLLGLSTAPMTDSGLPPALKSWAAVAMVAADVNRAPIRAALDVNGLKIMAEMRALAADRFVLRLQRSKIHLGIASLMNYGLSQRQAEVLALILRGSSNREIAATLSLSRRTIEKHVENILHILGVATRSAAISEIMARQETGH